MKGRFIHAVAGEMRGILGPQPVNVSREKGGDFYAGDISQHHPGIIFIAVRHPDTGFFGLLVDRHGMWRLVFEQREKRVDTCRPGSNYRNFLHRDLPVLLYRLHGK
ncbi:hypothetical protein D3C80_1124070 [compost metagenome]